MKKDARVDTEHPLLHSLLLQMRHLHIRRYVVRFLGYRAKKVCSGT